MTMNLARMRDVRRSRGLTQRELATRLRTDQPRIAKIENGLSVPDRTAQRIADVLLCNVADLVQPEDPVLHIRLSDLPAELRTKLVR
jgi:transcriptional regulator with XRE-family HTH domain